MGDNGLVDSCAFVITVRSAVFVRVCVQACVVLWGGSHFFFILHRSCNRTVYEGAKLSASGCLLLKMILTVLPGFSSNAEPQ